MIKKLPSLLPTTFLFTLMIPGVLFAAPTELTTRSVSSRDTITRITVSPGATVYRETDGFQTTFSVMRQWGPVFFGLESGYMRWPPSNRADYTGMPVGQTTIPMMATVFYRFDNDVGVYPYLGASVGMGVTRRDGGSNTLFQFQATARPGVEFEIGKMVSFIIEPRVGILDDGFLFAPMVGLALSI